MHFIQKAQVEVRIKSLAEGVSEGVQVGHALRVVEGHQPPLVVQVDSDPGQGLFQRQDLGRRRAGHVLYPVGEGQGPEAVGREGLDHPLPGHGLPGDPHRPDGAAVHLHLPVVAPVGETLAAQEGQGGVEPGRVVLHRVVKGLVADAGEGGGEAEPGVGCAGVEGDGCRNFGGEEDQLFLHLIKIPL